jgi:hypothetical protein
VDIEAIREGMTVYSEDGKKLGKVIRRDGDDLVIEKGLITKREYVATLDDVARVEGDRIWLRETADEIESAPEESEPAVRKGPPPLPRESETDRMSARPDEEEEMLVFIEEEVVVELPPDDVEPGVKAPGRNPNGRR